MKVALFITCLADQFYPQVGVATVRLLQRFGCTVSFPKSQTCCGQPAFNSGYIKPARDVAVNFVNSFADCDYIVSPSGSCTGMVRHYYHELFAGDSKLETRAREVTEKTYELSQFLVRVLKVEDIGATFPHKVAFHPSCHGSRLLGVRDEPGILLRNVRDLTLVDLPDSQDCCGFGGTFAVKMANVSGAMVAEKVRNVETTHVEYLVGTDMGCLMNINGAMTRQKVPTKSIHLAELLYRGIDQAHKTAELAGEAL